MSRPGRISTPYETRYEPPTWLLVFAWSTLAFVGGVVATSAWLSEVCGG